MEKFSLINIPDIGQPIASVINNFINKIADALGWVVTPKNLKPTIIEANKGIIDEILQNKNIHPMERAAFINNYKKICKNYENQINIMELACKDLKPNIEPNNVNNDWINFFFDKVKNITDDAMKIIWAKILAEEFNEPNTYSKQLIHILSIMDKEAAHIFNNLRSCCFYIPPRLYTFIYRSECVIKNSNLYNNLGLSYEQLKILEALGLIMYRYPHFYSIKYNEGKIYYNNKIITLGDCKNRIMTGNVQLTNVGKQLCKIVPIEYNDKVLEICIDTWKRLGYTVNIELIK